MRDLILWAIDFIVRILKLILWVAIAFLIIEIFLAFWPGASIHLKIGEPIIKNTAEKKISKKHFINK